MQIFTKDEIERQKEILHKKLREGAVFVYPTDTIYGIGCVATDDSAVRKVRRIKKRAEKPFSVIAPSKEWIYENCEVHKAAEDWIKKLPGPYTLVLKQKNRSAVAKSVNPSIKTLGVRIPDHWISDFVAELGAPVITPSANQCGKEFMTSAEDIDPEIQSGTDFMLDEGERKGEPSRIIDLSSPEEQVILR